MGGSPTYSWKGPVYNPETGEWRDVPIFPVYMEDAHYKWLGIQKPDEYAHEAPRVVCINGDAPCTEGATYIFIALNPDGSEGKWLDLMRWWEYFIIPKNCTAEAVDRWGTSSKMVTDSGGRLKMGPQQGIRVLEVNRCMGSAGWVWMMKPIMRLKTYGDYSVTATMSAEFDVDLVLHSVDPKSSFFRS